MPCERMHAVNNPVRWREKGSAEGYVRVRLRLLTADEGGRKTPIADGYRACWDIGTVEDGKPCFNDAPLLLEEGDTLDLGVEATVRLHPLAWQYWGEIRSGQVITMHEGRKLVGRATVLARIGPGNGC